LDQVLNDAQLAMRASPAQCGSPIIVLYVGIDNIATTAPTNSLDLIPIQISGGVATAHGGNAKVPFWR
jgi:hypothetical protein